MGFGEIHSDSLEQNFLDNLEWLELRKRLDMVAEDKTVEQVQSHRSKQDMCSNNKSFVVAKIILIKFIAF